MCFRKLFGCKPDEPNEMEYTRKTALLFAINNYPGSSNNLRGCLNDQKMVKEWLSVWYPEFTIYEFKDKQVTKKIFKDWIAKFKDKLQPDDDLFIHLSGHGTRGFDGTGDEIDGYSEALYLHDGPVWDYELRWILSDIPEGARITLALDTCFSGGAISRKNNYLKPRFIETQKIPEGTKRKVSFLKDFEVKNFVQFAACGEGQTAADAYIDGQYCGAFTHCWMKTFQDQLLTDWLTATKDMIKNFTQIPELYGDLNMKNNFLFTN